MNAAGDGDFITKDPSSGHVDIISSSFQASIIEDCKVICERILQAAFMQAGVRIVNRTLLATII